MSLMMGAIAGLGKGMSDVAEQNNKNWAAQELMQLQAQVQGDKELRVKEFDQAPYGRAGGLISASSQQQVPVTAPPVTQLSGDNTGVNYTPGPDETNAKGFVGDYAKLAAQIQGDPSISAEDKAAALKQLATQRSGDQAQAQAAVAGQTRAPTSDEALDAAYAKALQVGDAKAAAVIKSLMADKFTKVEANSAVLNRKGELVFQNDTGQKNLEAKLDSAEKIAAAKLEILQEKMNNALAGVGKDPSRITEAKSYMDAINKENEKLGLPQITFKEAYDAHVKQNSDTGTVAHVAQTIMDNGGVGDKEAWKKMDGGQKFDAAMEAARRSLAKKSTTSASAVTVLPAGATQVGTSGGKPVYQTPDGKRFIAQ